MSLVAVEEVRAMVLAACGPLRPSAIPIDDALGCVTSVPLRAESDVPPFANTAMDGYAVRAADTAAAPVRLRVVATLAAGAAPTVAVREGEAIRIMTGAPIPDGADAIVMVELTAPEDDGAVVSVQRAVPVGNHIRPAGEDVACGQEVFAAGTVLGPGHLGVLASLGMRRVPVVARPRVGVLSTGDELVDGPEALRPGQIRDANRHTLLALARAAGCIGIDLGLVRDDEEALAAAFAQAVATCDVVITSGGVSVGDFDYVKVVLDRLAGGTMRWMQIAVKPAKPFAFGTIGDVPVFGLPGNPVSSMVSFELFARPALRKMLGHDDLDRPKVRAVADEALTRRRDGKLHVVRVVGAFGDDGRLHVRSAGGQASNLLRSMALADALALLADGDGVAAGGEVDVILLG